MSIDFKELFNQLKTAIIGLAKDTVKQYAAEAASDGTSLLHNIEDDLKKYGQQLADGKITKDDFQLLLLGKQDQVEMTALTEAGLAEAKADAFKKAVFNIIIDTVLKFI
jgi:hypothetical protein